VTVDYELHLGGSVSLAAVGGWCSMRPGYRLEGGGVSYSNQDTGVSFRLSESGRPAFPIALRLATVRPEPFALEAEIELSELVAAFGLLVEPSPAMPDGRYSPARFVAGWRAASDARVAVLSSQGKLRVARAPGSAIHHAWSWNLVREVFMEILCELDRVAGFAPTVLLVSLPSEPDRIRTAAVWSDAQAIALPEVELLLTMGTAAPPGAPLGLVPVDRIGLLLGQRFEMRSGARTMPFRGRDLPLGMRHLVLDHPEPPPELIRALIEAALPFEPPTRFALDQVLEVERGPL
jgi:hypothetical protein